MKPSPSSEEQQRVSRFRFGIAGLMMIMFIACAMGAAGFYFMRSLSAGGLDFGDLTSGDEKSAGRLIFILITLAGPMLIMVILSGLAGFLMWLRGR